MRITRALKTIMEMVRGELVVAANGRISREAFTLRDRPENFYMIGSMGLASSIALGLALSQPKRKVVVLDGDGNVLMNLGVLPQIGALLPPNLLHIVLDNEVYGSTGNQRTISSAVGLEKIARSSGYLVVKKITEEKSLRPTLRQYLKARGPVFLLAKVEAEVEPKGIKRVMHSPVEIRNRFMKSIGGRPFRRSVGAKEGRP